VLYLTSLTGFEIARIERSTHGGRAPSTTSPERPQRCNQLWLDPILRAHASSFESVTLRYRTRFDSFVEEDDCIVASVYDRDRDEQQTIVASYLIDCSGGHSAIRQGLGIEMDGDPTIDYNLSIFFRIPELWSYHDKGKAALHFIVDKNGIHRNLVQLDGRELWRLGVTTSKAIYDDPDGIDADALITEVIGRVVPYELIGVRRWVTSDLVAQRYRSGRVMLAGDAAHLNSPSGGFGLNTSMATLSTWAGRFRPSSTVGGTRTCLIRTRRSAGRSRYATSGKPPKITCATGCARRIRRSRTRARTGCACAANSVPRSCARNRRRTSPTAPRLATATIPRPFAGTTARHPRRTRSANIARRAGRVRVHHMPGCRRQTRRSICSEPISRCCASARMHPIRQPSSASSPRCASPLATHSIGDAHAAELYERRLVLVRPDGHVAWRSDDVPADPRAVAERVRGG